MNSEVENILKEKKYPLNYPADAIAILNALSFTGGKDLVLVGSQQIRSQKYAGDYDAYEEVNVKGKTVTAAVKSLVTGFKAIVTHLKSIPNLFIGDIKAGLVPEWTVLSEDYKQFSYNKSTDVLKKLLKAKIISQYEYNDNSKLLNPKLTLEQFLIAKNNIKFHIVRWTPATVAAGKQTLRNGRVYTLAEAFEAPTIVKLDTIGLVNKSRFTEFSCIYQFIHNGKPINNFTINIEQSLKESIISYTTEGKLFKVLKRKFALAKFMNNQKELLRLNPILNGELGQLYVIQSDLTTLLSLLEYADAPIKLIKHEMGQFIDRFSNIYSVKSFLRIEPKLIDDIKTALQFTNKSRLISRLKIINEEIEDVLNKSTKEVIKGGCRCNYKSVIR